MGHSWVRAAPAAAALLYPALLAATYRSAAWLHTSGTVGSAVALALSLALTFAAPAIALAFAVKWGRSGSANSGDTRARGVAHLAFASPALFTFLGVIVYLDGFPSADYLVWAALWVAIVV